MRIAELSRPDESRSSENDAGRPVAANITASSGLLFLHVADNWTATGPKDDEGFEGDYPSSSSSSRPNWPILFLFGVVAMTIVGNLLVCAAVCCNRKLQNMFNFFLVSLALSDTMSAILVMPLSIIRSFMEHLSVPKLLCVTWYSLDVLFTSSTICHLCMTSVDRYISLRSPLRHRSQSRNKRSTLVKISAVWAISFCIAGPLFVLSMLDQRDMVQYKGCGPETQAFVVSATLASFYVPLAIMTVMYALTVRALKRQLLEQRYLTVNSAAAAAAAAPVGGNDSSSFGDVQKPPVPVDGVEAYGSPVPLSCSLLAADSTVDHRHHHHHHQQQQQQQRRQRMRSRQNALRLDEAVQSPYSCTIDGTLMSLCCCLSSAGNSIASSDFTNAAYDHATTTTTSSVGLGLGLDVRALSPPPPSSQSQSQYPAAAAATNNTNCPAKRDAALSRIGRRRHGLEVPANSVWVSSGGLRGQTRPLPTATSTAAAAAGPDRGRRAVLVLGVLFAVFVVFYLPFFGVYFLNGTCSGCRPFISDRIITGFEWLQYSGSMVNPFVYHFFNPDFQRAFHRLLKCRT